MLKTESWQFLFTVMAVLGASSIFWIILGLANERKPEHSNDDNTTSLLSIYGMVLKNKRFRHYLLMALTGQMLFIYYISVAPMYLIGKLGVSQMEFGQMFMMIAFVFMGFSFITPKIGERLSIKMLLIVAVLACLVGAISMFAMSGLNTWYALIAPMAIVAMGCTMLLGACPAKALADFKENAGVASGLYTATTLGVGSMIAGGFVKLVDSQTLPYVALVFVGVSIFALIWLMTSSVIKQDSVLTNE